MRWRPVIGFEVHAQLKTRTKLFSAAPCPGGSDGDLSPNTFVDAGALALPGTLPVVNAEAIRLAARLGLALGCEVHPASQFSRKHYFYPDQPRGYQISQFYEPICRGGALPVTMPDGRVRAVPLTQIHLEDDAGKTVHDAEGGRSLVDLNRAGVPLVEIVSAPAMHDVDEAVAFLKALHQLLIWLDICDGDMEAGNFRFDANVSVHREGEPLGTRTEIKNINSFRFAGHAIASEIARQSALLEQGGAVVMETRRYEEQGQRTVALRVKEAQSAYRHLPDPDLGAARVTAEMRAALLAEMPELPHEAHRRLEALGLGYKDRETLLQDRAHLAFFDRAARVVSPQLAANWIVNDLFGVLGRHGLGLAENPIPEAEFHGLLLAFESGKLSSRMAKEALGALFEGESLDGWMAAHGGQVSDPAALQPVIDAVLEAHPEQWAAYVGGRDRLFGFFVGQVMRQLGGKADPNVLTPLLRASLERKR